MAISTVSTNSLADMMLSQMKEKDKKTQEEGAGFADMLAGRPSAAGARPAEAEEAPSLSAKKADPVQDFLDYMKMTPEERMQEAWLRQHGISKEDWDAMPAEKKQALMDEMKREIQEKIEDAARKGGDEPKLLIGFGLG